MKDGRKCILVADDDLQIRQIFQLLLSSEGYAVLTAENGMAAAEMAGKKLTCICWMWICPDRAAFWQR